MSEEFPLVDRVLQRVRATAAPPPGSATRVLSGVARQVAGGAPVHPGAGAAPQPTPPPAAHVAVAPPAVARQSTWALHVVRLGRWVVFGLAAGGVGYWWGFQRAAHAPLEHVAAPVEQRVVGPSVVLSPAQPSAPAQPDFAPPSAPSSEPEPEPARAAPVARGASEAPARRRLAPRRATAPSLQPLDLHEALQLLSRAQSALRKGLPDRALELLDQLEQRQPGELLMEERRVTRILTLCELGEVDQARAVRQTLGPGPVSSIYAGRLDASCAGVEPASTDLKNSVPRPDPAAPDTTRP